MDQRLYDYYKEIFNALTVANFSLQRIYEPIADDLINKADMHITRQHIPYYKDDKRYDENTDRKMKTEESATWWELINRRERTAINNTNVKLVYDNFTKRLLYLRLCQQKNEFEQYDAISNEMYRIMLADTCTYEELLKYTDFSTEWDPHLQNYQ